MKYFIITKIKLLLYVFKLSLNGSLYCTLNLNSFSCDLSHILFNWLSLSNKHLFHITRLNFNKSINNTGSLANSSGIYPFRNDIQLFQKYNYQKKKKKIIKT